jgi:hypothetical protein
MRVTSKGPPVARVHDRVSRAMSPSPAPSRTARAYSDGHPLDAVQYREYKLILKPERFADPDGFHAFGKIVRDVARGLDVAVSRQDVPAEDRLREVLFYDTARFALYEGAFIIRRRTPHRDGWPTADPELTVKFRHPDLNAAAAVDVRPATERTYRIKFKEELLPLRDRAGGMRSLFSHTCVLTAPAAHLDADLARALRVFPALRVVLERAGPQLAVVQEARITEVLEVIGLLDFGHGVEGKADLAVWRRHAIGPALIAEFSFQVRFTRDEEQHKKARKRADDLFVRLQTAARSWLALGLTKTAVVYGLGKTAPRHHE